MKRDEERLIQNMVHSFGDALFTTIHEAKKESGKAKEGRPKVYDRWDRFADAVTAYFDYRRKQEQ